MLLVLLLLGDKRKQAVHMGGKGDRASALLLHWYSRLHHGGQRTRLHLQGKKPQTGKL